MSPISVLPVGAGLLTTAFMLFTLATASGVEAQIQQPRLQPGWPCTGTIDPTYVRTAEATGGNVLLLDPSEMAAGSVAAMGASNGHSEVVFRVGGQLKDGLHEFEVPIDSTIESASVFVTLQCMDAALIFLPSGDELRADAGDVKHHAFRAVRLFEVPHPAPGIWRIRVSGSGVFSLIVKARTDLRLNRLTYAQGGMEAKRRPALGHLHRVEAGMSGATGSVEFTFLSSIGSPIQAVALELEQEGDEYRTYAGQVEVPRSEFRLAVSGTDAKGFRFQRVDSRLAVE